MARTSGGGGSASTVQPPQLPSPRSPRSSAMHTRHGCSCRRAGHRPRLPRGPTTTALDRDRPVRRPRRVGTGPPRCLPGEPPRRARASPGRLRRARSPSPSPASLETGPRRPRRRPRTPSALSWRAVVRPRRGGRPPWPSDPARRIGRAARPSHRRGAATGTGPSASRTVRRLRCRRHGPATGGMGRRLHDHRHGHRSGGRRGPRNGRLNRPSLLRRGTSPPSRGLHGCQRPAAKARCWLAREAGDSEPRDNAGTCWRRWPRPG
jgi:hypothetical protein